MSDSKIITNKNYKRNCIIKKKVFFFLLEIYFVVLFVFVVLVLPVVTGPPLPVAVPLVVLS